MTHEQKPESAAEQRRKDAEGAEPVAWMYRTRDGSHCVTRYIEEAELEGIEIFPLSYTRPANVAALEARVEELEGEVERLKTPEWVCDEETSYADVYDALSQRDDPILGITKLTACRSVRDIWAFLDEKFVVYEFSTGIDARNAAAAIREGEQP